MRSNRSPAYFEPVEPRLLLATIGGTVFSDLDGNGVRGGNEPGLSNWTVYLDLNRDHSLNAGEPTAVTDGSGNYTFSNVAPGNYSVAQVVPAGWMQTRPSVQFPVVSPAAAPAPPARSILTSDSVRSALARLGDLSSYTRGQLQRAQSWVIGLPQGTSIDSIAKALGPVSIAPGPALPDSYILTFSTSRASTLSIAPKLAATTGISFFYPLVASAKPLRAIPDDPLFPNEWHLLNTGQTTGAPGNDADVTPVWDNYRGDGVTIGVVDDGLEYTHEDLAANYVPSLSYDFFSNDADPAPGSGDVHGTAVAGIAAARGFNGIGVSGAAPNASIAGIRLVSGATTDQQEASSLFFHPNDIDIYTSSWGPADFGDDLQGPGPLTLAAIQNGATTGRNGLGNIYTWAAGNGLQFNDNVNYDGYANDRYVIAVSAIDSNGVQSYYSEPGAPLLVAGYSSGSSFGTTTTDRTGTAGYSFGNYTSNFGGTSSSAPLVAGVVALMLQANPNLTWRDVQSILAHSARKNDPLDAGWSTNSAGLHINPKYGFGAIDAAAAVALAQNWTNLAPEQSVTSGTINVNTAIPDNDSTGVTSTFNLATPLRAESIEVVLNVTHPRRGQLRVVLTSPTGTQSVLQEVHNDTNANITNWVYSTKRDWDELAAGNWTLKVTDGQGGFTGTWNSWKINFYGTSPSSTSYSVVVNAPDTVSGLDFGNYELAPSVASSIFHFQTGQNITFTFNRDVSGISADDLLLTNTTTSTPVTNISVSYDSGTHTATFTFPDGLLANGNYQATLLASGFTDLGGMHMTADATLNFFVLAGDANHDGHVDSTDLGILSLNWEQSPRDFTQGDFNYDHVVNVDDLNILAANWQQNVLPTLSPIAPPSARRPVARVAALVLG
ncbi:MAG TPA: S8 family serine peptidase [Tepidisphaeraceae bacterium]|jgi:subtilisin-like proprotein convertase family protein